MTACRPLRLTYRFLLVITLLFWARTQVQAQFGLNSRANRQLQQLVEFSETFEQGHTGFVLYDLDFGTELYGYQADRRFVPASNVKLLTFLLAHRVLGHRTPGLLYQEYADRYEVWGAGYPLLLHPAFTGYDEVAPWLRTLTKPLRLNFPAGTHQAVPRYGAGWSWDDYNDGYVYERSALPVYGNRLFLDLTETDAGGRQTLIGAPFSVASGLVELPEQRARIRRAEFGNQFTVRPGFIRGPGFPVERPLHLSPDLITNELAAALPERSVSLGYLPYPAAGQAQQLPVSLPDTVYRRLLTDSDNFLAEQLLIAAAVQRYGRPAVGPVLAYGRDTLLAELGVDDVRWADGSGLSRYNLFTPRHLARVVMALDQEVGRDRLRSLLPAGGVSGTLANRFAGAEQPYVWAKTGSLSGVVCVSGLVLTKRGKWLAFSFMHNNFVGGSGPYYRDMERTLRWCYDNL